ncbi:Cytoplasmic membrane protein [Magnetospirillum sp. LM-5]|uniref:FxsA family protein n=1 Tax=Magnetospirillum sp. LM-5 TaxID=2681466 RepID=UPI0013845147|nr:FxsA family protein [Magnetospirillum sp. LM-5]CAA7617557.1 Cytoplasmic membrane protein [Magnetospirillum sp. LM-5]
MAWLLILAVIAVPVIEITLFVQAVDLIGGVATILLALGAGIAGLALVRAQGLITLSRVHDQLGQGQMPVAELFDGLCLSLAGGLLVLPGFLSDMLAILLILAPVRALIRLWLAKRLVMAHPGPPPGPAVIDGEYTVVDAPEAKRLDS